MFALCLLAVLKIKNALKESKNSQKEERNLSKKSIEGMIVEVSH